MKNSKAGSRASAPKAAGGAKPDPKLGQDIQAKIGRQLRAIYDDVVNQGVPDRFVELLNRLDEQGGRDTDT
jgi:Anti-sigma factor NepR